MNGGIDDEPELPFDGAHDESPSNDGNGGFASDEQGLNLTSPVEQYDVAGYVLGALSDDESVAVRTAVVQDAQLANDLYSYEAVTTELALVVPHSPINRGRSAGIRSRLVSKAASSREGHGPVSRKVAEVSRPTAPLAVPAPSTASVPPRREVRSTPGGRAVAAVPNMAQNATPSVATPPAKSSFSKAAPTKLAETPSANAAMPVAPSSDYLVISKKDAPNKLRRRYRAMLVGTIGLGAAAVVGVAALQEWRMAQMRDGSSGSVVVDTVASRASAPGKRMDSLMASNAQKDSALAHIAGADVKIIDLINYSSSAPLARVFWDRKSAQWTMVAYHVRQPKPGKMYQVWLFGRDNAAPVSAGMFTPNPDGTYMMQMKHEMDPNGLVKIAVSEEPMGGATAPSGPIIIAGAGR